MPVRPRKPNHLPALLTTFNQSSIKSCLSSRAWLEVKYVCRRESCLCPLRDDQREGSVCSDLYLTLLSNQATHERRQKHPPLRSPHKLNHPPAPKKPIFKIERTRSSSLLLETDSIFSSGPVLSPFYFQLIHLSANNRCTGFSADTVTHMGTVRLAAQVPAPYGSPCKYQSVHLGDLKEPY